MMYRFLHFGISRYRCDTRCLTCCVRFRCYTTAEFEGLLLTDDEHTELWKKVKLVASGVPSGKMRWA